MKRAPWTTLLKHTGTGILGGATFSQWWKLLGDNKFHVEPRYWPRALNLTLASTVNSLVKRHEDRVFGPELENPEIPAPLFILGAWRSGTTHLFNLMAQDDRFGYPTTYDVVNPHTCLTMAGPGARLLHTLAPGTRPMDRMKQGAYEPSEEDMAMVPAGMSSMLGLVFPSRRDHYWRYVTLDEVDPDELASWRQTYLRFVGKMTLARGRPLILKSPANTGRIRLLLDMFPEARFVTIHRHPHEIYQSTRHTWVTTTPWWRLHGGSFDSWMIIRRYAELFDAYFDQRALIPEGRLHEVAFTDLEENPLNTLNGIYESLGLPAFPWARPAIEAYLADISGYRRNVLEDPPRVIAERLARQWPKAFDNWGYERVGASSTLRPRSQAIVE